MEPEIRARLDEKRYREAFDLIVPEYQNKVFRLAYSMLGNAASAEDAAQDIFVRIWKALAAYRGQSSISTWIYSIARNTCLTAIKANALRSISLDEPRIRLLAERRGSSAAQVGSGLDWEQLLSELPEKYRQVLVLYYMQQKSYDDVAAILGVPMGTVKTNLHRAKKDLAAAIRRSTIGKESRDGVR